MKKKAGRNYQEEKEQGPDCCTCLERKTCERYAENSYCTRWHSKEPEPQGSDPNKLWEQGEEVAF